MYTTAGKLAMMTLRNVINNFEETTEILINVTQGSTKMAPASYAQLVRLNQDLHDCLVQRAEQLGKTNVRGSTLKF